METQTITSVLQFEYLSLILQYIIILIFLFGKNLLYMTIILYTYSKYLYVVDLNGIINSLIWFCMHFYFRTVRNIYFL